MDKETDFRDNNSNVEVFTGWENDFSNKDQEWNVKTLCDKKNSFSTKNQKIGADSNKEMSSDKAIWATVGYDGFGFIVLNL